jgi:hypothetical protein
MVGKNRPHPNKIAPLWVILRVDSIVPATDWTVEINGFVVGSNFLSTGPIVLPGIRKPLEEIGQGEILRLTWYVSKNKVRPDPDATLAFADKGLKYEKEGAAGWELLFEEMGEV